MTDNNKYLYNMFELYLDKGFEHLKERTNKANIVLGLSAAIIGLITFDNKIWGMDFFAILLYIFVNIFGTVWIYKHHERYGYYLRRARAYRKKLDDAIPEFDIQEINDSADRETETRHNLVHRLNMWKLWLIFSVINISIGVLLLLVYFVNLMVWIIHYCGG